MAKRRYISARERALRVLKKVKQAEAETGKKAIYLKPGVSGENLKK